MSPSGAELRSLCCNRVRVGGPRGNRVALILVAGYDVSEGAAWSNANSCYIVTKGSEWGVSGLMLLALRPRVGVVWPPPRGPEEGAFERVA